MSTAAVFTIITNDGKQDKMLMATDYLSSRLATINNNKWASHGGASGPDKSALVNMPTLLDIERTHILFMNAHFKPFAAIGFEYNKVSMTAGTPTLGSPLQFSIPQFGDFFHDICCHIVLKQPTLSVDTATVAPSDRPAMRWCHFPGERILKRVKQDVNGNPLDEYTYHAVNFHREFNVAPNKMLGWHKCMGQEIPEVGYVDQPNWAGSGVDNTALNSRIHAQVSVGNQTPTGQKVGDLELFIPLLFWYCKDIRLAVPSVAIPYGQRFINFDIATFQELCGLYPRGTGTWDAPNGTLVDNNTLKSIDLYINNIFVNDDIHRIFIARIAFSLIRVHRQQTYSLTDASGSLHLQQLKWPIEYLYLGIKMRDYHFTSNAVTRRQHLDKWHTFNKHVDANYKTTGQEVMKISNVFANGVATMAVGADGAVTIADTSNTDTLVKTLTAGVLLRIGGVLCTVVSVTASGSAAGDLATGVTSLVVTVGAYGTTYTGAAVAATADVKFVEYQGLSVTTKKEVSTADDIVLKVHSISLYEKFPKMFYNAYTTMHYGGPYLNTPKDSGVFFVPFCLYPGTYQPSGHINVSRAREFYLDYNSSVVDNANTGTMVVLASAINFLLISDGSAVLRYST